MGDPRAWEREGRDTLELSQGLQTVAPCFLSPALFPADEACGFRRLLNTCFSPCCHFRGTEACGHVTCHIHETPLDCVLRCALSVPVLNMHPTLRPRRWGHMR